MKSTTRITDLFDNASDFQQLLDDAERQAKSEWDQEFVWDVKERYEKYGDGMFLSERQREILERIVG